MNLISEKLFQLEEEDPEAYVALIGIIESESKFKGDLIVENGKICKGLYVIQNGLAKHYRLNEEGKEYNTWFSFEGSVLLSVQCFIFNTTPSPESIELLEDTDYHFIAFNRLTPLLAKHHAIETIFREVCMDHMMKVENRLHRLQAYSAIQKYQYIVSEHPQMIERISQKDIASYLGVSRETVSRIRAKTRSLGTL